MTTVRRADTLVSLMELGLTAETRTHLGAGGDFSSLDMVIWEGRCIAYEYSKHPENYGSGPDWARELVLALEDAGFIRHDITSGSFCVAQLYRAVYPDLQITLPTMMCDLKNEGYERFKNYPDCQKESIGNAIESCLGVRDAAILLYHFGFRDGRTHSFQATAEHFHMPLINLRVNMRRSLEKLRKTDILSPVSYVSYKEGGII